MTKFRIAHRDPEDSKSYTLWGGGFDTYEECEKMVKAVFGPTAPYLEFVILKED